MFFCIYNEGNKIYLERERERKRENKEGE